MKYKFTYINTYTLTHTCTYLHYIRNLHTDIQTSTNAFIDTIHRTYSNNNANLQTYYSTTKLRLIISKFVQQSSFKQRLNSIVVSQCFMSCDNEFHNDTYALYRNVRWPLAVRYSGMFIISEFPVRRDDTSDRFWNFSAIYQDLSTYKDMKDIKRAKNNRNV